MIWHDIRRARKAHRCWLCREPIEVGRRYVDQRVIDDGLASRLREHLGCHVVGVAALWANGHEDGYDDELVKHWLDGLPEADMNAAVARDDAGVGPLDPKETDRAVAFWRRVNAPVDEEGAKARDAAEMEGRT